VVALGHISCYTFHYLLSDIEEYENTSWISDLIGTSVTFILSIKVNRLSEHNLPFM
jgi:hypothetical protein